MKELKVSLVTENITDEQLDKLDKFINKVFLFTCNDYNYERIRLNKGE